MPVASARTALARRLQGKGTRGGPRRPSCLFLTTGCPCDVFKSTKGSMCVARRADQLVKGVAKDAVSFDMKRSTGLMAKHPARWHTCIPLKKGLRKACRRAVPAPQCRAPFCCLPAHLHGKLRHGAQEAAAAKWQPRTAPRGGVSCCRRPGQAHPQPQVMSGQAACAPAALATCSGSPAPHRCSWGAGNA